MIPLSQSSDFFSGGGPQGWSIFSSIWNLTLALDSFSQIARWFVKSVWPIKLANVSLEKWLRSWFFPLQSFSPVLMSCPLKLGGVSMACAHVLGLEMLHLGEDVEPACAVCSRHVDV